MSKHGPTEQRLDDWVRGVIDLSPEESRAVVEELRRLRFRLSAEVIDEIARGYADLDEERADDFEYETGRIVITRGITAESADETFVEYPDEMGVVEALGLLRLAEDSILRRGVGDE